MGGRNGRTCHSFSFIGLVCVCLSSGSVCSGSVLLLSRGLPSFAPMHESVGTSSRTNGTT